MKRSDLNLKVGDMVVYMDQYGAPLTETVEAVGRDMFHGNADVEVTFRYTEGLAFRRDGVSNIADLAEAMTGVRAFVITEVNGEAVTED